MVPELLCIIKLHYIINIALHFINKIMLCYIN